MLTATIQRSFDDIFAEANEGADVGVARASGDRDGLRCPTGRRAHEKLLDDIKGVDGVEQAGGAIDDAVSSRSSTRTATVGPPRAARRISLNAYSPSRSPRSPISRAARRPRDEIALDTITADKENSSSATRITIAGTKRPATSSSSASPSSARRPARRRQPRDLHLPTAQQLTDKPGKFDIAVEAADGVSDEAAARPRCTRSCRTGRSDRRRGRRAGRQRDPGGLRLPDHRAARFAFIAVFVGAFLIFNTFSITVAQRTREFGAAAHARGHLAPGADVGDARGADDRHDRLGRSASSPGSAS